MGRVEVDDVKRAWDIVEFVRQYVSLKKAGQHYKGLCPFHEETEGSFTVSPSRQMFHCFGCRKGGDVIGFLMEKEGISFPSALAELAERAGIPLKSYSEQDGRKISEQNEIYNALEQASVFFQTQFPLSPAEKYTEKRKIKSETSAQFKIGYAPPGWENLLNALSPKFNEEILEKAGLIVKRESSGYYDRFRDRLIFPISNERGKITGFAGRALDDSIPKYLNSPETNLFKKKEILYGLHLALPHLREKKKLFIVEGYTDVILPAQEGFDTFIATAGTAFTKEYAELIGGLEKRFEGNLETILCFDGDSAGIDAAERAIKSAMNYIHNLKVCILPEGEDPASLLEHNKKKTLVKALESRRDAFDFFMDYHSKTFDLSYISGKMALLNNSSVREIIFNLPSNKQGIFIDGLARKIRLMEDKVREFLEIGPTRIINPFRRREFSAQQALLREILIKPSPEITGFLKKIGITTDYFNGIEGEIFEYLTEQNYNGLFNGMKLPLFERGSKENISGMLRKKGFRHREIETTLKNLFYKLPKKSSQSKLESAIANIEVQISLKSERDFLRKGGDFMKFLKVKRKAREELE
jgi:DNA primase catalytic core